MKATAARCPTCGGSSHGTCPRCAAAEQAAELQQHLGEGEPLGPSLRTSMEAGLGGPVPPEARIHTGPAAAAIAARHGVRAFALGADVGFAPGEFRPDTLAGSALIAHELAHTQQQSGSGGTVHSAAEGHEADADRGAAAVVGRMVGAPIASAGQRRSAALRLQGCPTSSNKPTGARPGQGLDSGLAPGEDTKGYTLNEYIDLWEKQQGRKMTPDERKRLALGCVGVTRTNLGGGAPTDECYTTLAEAQQRATELETSVGVRPFIFSKRFWTMGKAFPQDAKGKVDMSKDDNKGPPDEVNFDYGWYDEKSDTWWHANHCDPVEGSARCRQSYSSSERMKVYQSTLTHYSDPNYFGADKQVFCVAFTKLK